MKTPSKKKKKKKKKRRRPNEAFSERGWNNMSQYRRNKETRNTQRKDRKTERKDKTV